MSVSVTIAMVVVMPLAVSMIFIGAMNLHTCPAERYIPIYMVVMGIFTCCFLLLLRIQIGRQNEKTCIKTEGKEGKKLLKVLKVISVIVGLFVVAWFIAGNVWIYRLNNNYSPNSTAINYCDKSLYLYAFWVTTATHILIGLGIIIGCIFTIFIYLLCGKLQ